jgi:hypothetical protein
MRRNKNPYNSRLQKGGALLDDMRLLVREWEGGSLDRQKEEVIAQNLLGKRSRARVADTLRRAFVPRFVKGDPPEAWRIVRPLEDRQLPIEVLKPIYYWITARTERLLYDFVTEELVRLQNMQQPRIRSGELAVWIRTRLAKYGVEWTETVSLKVARGLLAGLRDFGILEGAAVKRIAPAYLPVEAFAYTAFALLKQGHSGSKLAEHPDWRLFLLRPRDVEHLFLEADRSGLLSYQAAGRLIRVEFAAAGYEEMAKVIHGR